MTQNLKFARLVMLDARLGDFHAYGSLATGTGVVTTFDYRPPEPATMLLLCAGAVVGLRRRTALARAFR
jgi:hypothetical protein